ncbi:MAG: hypothetical protein H6730_18860 [Deltaproteobacteria bacterium]|nr:hypothetical protein [Deltaproteobacteria bacterium]
MSVERGTIVAGFMLVGRHWDASLGPAWVARRVGAPEQAPLYLVRIFPTPTPELANRLLVWGEATSALPAMAPITQTLKVALDRHGVVVVSELVLGETLRQNRRAVGRWPLTVALAMVRSVGEALETLAAHPDPNGDPNGRAHGHIGADRVLLDFERNRLVVLEPGLDAAQEGRAPRRSDDVLGLGRLLFELLTGQPGETCPAGRSPVARASDQRVPRAVEALVACATAVDPGSRHGSVGAFLRDLNQCIRGQVDLPHQLGSVMQSRLASRLQGTRVLVSRWRRAPSTRGRPPSLAPTAPQDEGRGPPRLPAWQGASELPEARPLAEPGLGEGLLRTLPSVQPLIGPDTEDLAAITTGDLPAPKPQVTRLMRQLTLLGLLVALGLAASAYFETPHGAESIRVLLSLIPTSWR